MSDQPAKAWRCRVCGYIHRGDEPPETCPVCGATRENFEPYVEEPEPAAKPAAAQWRCVNCGYVHDGSEPPKTCPVCGAPRNRFEPLGATAEAGAEPTGLRRAVVIGAGVAGLSAAEALRAASPDTEIVLIAKEPGLPYYRLNLTRYVAGEVGEQDLPLKPESWYEESEIQLMRGAEAIDVDLDERVVHLRDGQTASFEKLILTAGAHPFIPPLPGTTREGVTRFRTVDDARRIVEAAERGAKIVCIGGGILGLETVGGLARRGADVTLLEGHEWLLPRQINAAASPLLERHLEGLGVRLRKQARVAEILGDEHVRSVLLKDARAVPADLVVIATGVRPNSYLARMAGLTVNQGVVVDNRLCTSNPDVLAAGDVAEHRGVVYGLWGPAQYMGSIAGRNAAGQVSEFGGIPRSTTLKVLGIDLFSIGQFDPLDASYEAYDHEGENTYSRFVFRDGLLVGAILLGDAALTAPVKSAVEGKTDLSGLLAKRPSAADVMDYLAERT